MRGIACANHDVSHHHHLPISSLYHIPNPIAIFYHFTCSISLPFGCSNLAHLCHHLYKVTAIAVTRILLTHRVS